ncbi:MAG: hypothetical protein LBU81_01910 [Methanosarcinales archaeon]|jgi:hypothetical protein|nr:hypothetical protein [Methanosarcinales archaeon]
MSDSLFSQNPHGGLYSSVGQKGLYRQEISVDVLMFLDAKKSFYSDLKIKHRFPDCIESYEDLCSEMYGIVEKVKPILLVKNNKKDVDPLGIALVDELEQFFA